MWEVMLRGSWVPQEMQFRKSREMSRLEIKVWISSHTAWKATRLDNITRKVEIEKASYRDERSQPRKLSGQKC